jgi:hypothetical protein
MKSPTNKICHAQCLCYPFPLAYSASSAILRPKLPVSTTSTEQIIETATNQASTL